MKNNRAVSAIAVFAAALAAHAQEPTWNDAQSSVWAIVEQSWVDDAAENGKWPAEYTHEKYMAWGDSSAAPLNRDSTINSRQSLEVS